MNQMKRRSRRTPASSIFNSPMANSSGSNALIILNNDSFIDNHKPMMPENSPALVPEMEKSIILVKERNEETESVPSLAVKESSESGALMMLKSESFTNIKDITVSEENAKIPWVNEINEVVPSRFRYIPQSVVFKDASVKKFSISSFSDEQCCFSSCIGDCLDSPCNCTVAYTVEGVLKDDFLEERISEALDKRKQVLRYCKECPLEKAKKEETLEPCKGHKKRKAIKECCIKCGCTKSCGNRVVQRGIRHKLEVFFMPNGKGWGLRTLENLRKGAFVCEYIGEILTISELYERRSKDEVTSHVRLDANWGCSEEGVEDNKAL